MCSSTRLPCGDAGDLIIRCPATGGYSRTYRSTVPRRLFPVALRRRGARLDVPCVGSPRWPCGDEGDLIEPKTQLRGHSRTYRSGLTQHAASRPLADIPLQGAAGGHSRTYRSTESRRFFPVALRRRGARLDVPCVGSPRWPCGHEGDLIHDNALQCQTVLPGGLAATRGPTGRAVCRFPQVALRRRRRPHTEKHLTEACTYCLTEGNR